MQRLRIVVAALFVIAITASATLAQRFMSVQPGRYEIEVTLTGKVLDLRQEDMRSVQQFYRGTVKNQQWDIELAGGNHYYIRSAQNGAYLGVEGTARDGARVVATPGSRQDTWRFMETNNGTVMIIHRSGKVLDLTAGATQDGAPMQVWGQAGNTHQQFRLVPVNLAVAGYEARNADRPIFDYDPSTSNIENNEAYRAGVNDRVNNRSQNYRRHRSLYDRFSEQEFARSYNLGYSASYNRNQRSNNGWQPDLNDNDLAGLNQSERNNYREAYRLGRQDARDGYSASYRRHNTRYNRWQETIFQRGYEAGYNSFNNNNDQFDLNRLSTSERRAYDEGYRLGQQDARSGYSLDYRRYINRINDTRLARFLQRGYEVGYNSARRY